MSLGNIAPCQRSASAAMGRASNPPSSESSALSVSSWRISRLRPLPIDRRTAISRCRADARASMRLATFAQATSRISPTPNRPSPAASSSTRGGTQRGESNGVRADVSRAPRPLFVAGCVSLSPRANTLARACARCMSTPSGSRPTIMSGPPPRPCIIDSVPGAPKGIHSSDQKPNRRIP